MTLRRVLSANFVFLALLILAILVVCSGTAYIVYRQKNAVISESLIKTALQTKAFEEHLTRNLENIQHLADLVVAGPPALKTQKIDVTLQQIVRQAPFLRSLSLLDSSNRIIASSNLGNIGKIPELQSFYPPETILSHTGLRIGSPWAGRDFSDGTPLEKLATVDSTTLGFVPLLYHSEGVTSTTHIIAALNPDFFINYFTQWLSPEDGSVEILRYDRLTLFSSDINTHPGNFYTKKDLIQKLEHSEIGHFHEQAQGARPSFTAFRASRLFPLVIITHDYEDKALEPYRNERNRLLALVGISLFSLTCLALTLHRRETRFAAQEEAERRQEYERLAATVFETVLEAVMVSDANHRIIAVNPAFSRITGYSLQEAIGENFSLLATGYENDEFYEHLQQSLIKHGKWEGEVRNRRKSGEIFVAWLSVNQVRNDRGEVLYLVTGFSDITEYCAEAERISHLAHHDLLTGLPNRALLLDRLKQGVLQARRNSTQLAVLFFDLDKFKPVNDTLGHTVGDRLLQTLAEKVSSVVRAADTFARLGGDEFVVLLPIVSASQDALIVAEKIRQAVSQPFQIDQQTIHISTSIGIAFFPDHAILDDELLKRADAAMYQAKARGGNRYEIYQTEIEMRD